MNSTAFEVEGGHRLHGSIQPQGAKNEALQVICTCLLTDQVVRIDNIPNIVDVNKLIQLLQGMGVIVTKINDNCYEFEAKNIDLNYCYSEEFRKHATKIRGSVMLLGPLLARYGKAILPQPGGDKIGRRRLDTHFGGFVKLGAEFHFNKKDNLYSIETKELKGEYILMDEISVTGTANIVMAAVLAKGETTIYNAACEPYLQQLCTLLNSMGARITGIGTNQLIIQGVDQLHGANHKILPDMIEVGSFIGLAAMTGSEITIKNVNLRTLGTIPSVFKKLGITIIQKGDDILVPQQDHYEIEDFIDGSIMTIYDSPWPGFTPDLMSIVLVVAIQAKGSILIHQKMFESRLFFVDKLIDMGAKIILCDPHRATVIGLNKEVDLRGITMSSPDIRAGVALLIAALSAKGNSTILNINQIDRGYENIDERLRALGAHIKRI